MYMRQKPNQSTECFSRWILQSIFRSFKKCSLYHFPSQRLTLKGELLPLSPSPFQVPFFQFNLLTKEKQIDAFRNTRFPIVLM